MDVAYDPAKDASDFAKHGLSPAGFDGFDTMAAAMVDKRVDYGETRFRAFGRIGGKGYCVAFTGTATGLRLISFRRARAREGDAPL